VVALEDEAKGSATQCCQRIGIQCRDVFAVEQILSAARAVETAQNVHQRRFTGARRAHDRDELSSLNIERDAVQHLNSKVAIVIGLADIIQSDEGRVSYGIFGHETAHQNRRMPGLRPRCPAAASAPLDALVTTTLSPSSRPLLISVCTRLRAPVGTCRSVIEPLSLTTLAEICGLPLWFWGPSRLEFSADEGTINTSFASSRMK